MNQENFKWTDESREEYISELEHRLRYAGELPTMFRKDFIEKFENKKQKPILITEDGVRVYLRDTVWYVGKKTLNIGTHFVHCGMGEGYFESYLYFSTEEKAKEYVLLNKPCLSVNDVCISFDRWLVEKKESLRSNLKELAKQKI